MVNLITFKVSISVYSCRLTNAEFVSLKKDKYPTQLIYIKLIYSVKPIRELAIYSKYAVFQVNKVKDVAKKKKENNFVVVIM